MFNRSTHVKVGVLALAGALTMTSGLAVAQQAPPVDFGDLIILYRDADGVPILTPGDPAPGGTGLCQQPLAFNEADPDDLCPDSCVVPSIPAGEDVVEVDQSTCAVASGCEACTHEVEFGRLNEARSSDEVFNSQLQDVVVNLATSDCEVTLDPAGRMVTGKLLTDDPSDPPLPDEYTTSAIDSPLQNLAIYRQLIQTGDIGVALPQGATDLETAARGLGAASDKSGGVNMDLVAYLNQIMGLSEPATPTILGPPICIQVREEVQGTVQLVQKCFLDYSGYGYNRNDNFLALPAPPYIPDGIGTAGWFEYLAILDGTIDPPSFTIDQGPIVDAVFGAGTGDLENIEAFAQAADDTRAVIDYMHNWPIPNADEYATPVPCMLTEGITYDVSISDVSGLQVPKNYVSGTEREFIVTVANGGPDPATGTVTVTGVLGTGVVVPGSPWTFGFTELGEGQSASFTQLFSVTSPATTITWTATAYAQYDVVPSNNTVVKTSNIKGGGGGGGQGRP
jgi:hypothetical protein